MRMLDADDDVESCVSHFAANANHNIARITLLGARGKHASRLFDLGAAYSTPRWPLIRPGGPFIRNEQAMPNHSRTITCQFAIIRKGRWRHHHYLR